MLIVIILVLVSTGLIGLFVGVNELLLIVLAYTQLISHIKWILPVLHMLLNLLCIMNGCMCMGGRGPWQRYRRLNVCKPIQHLELPLPHMKRTCATSTSPFKGPKAAHLKVRHFYPFQGPCSHGGRVPLWHRSSGCEIMWLNTKEPHECWFFFISNQAVYSNLSCSCLKNIQWRLPKFGS